MATSDNQRKSNSDVAVVQEARTVSGSLQLATKQARNVAKAGGPSIAPAAAVVFRTLTQAEQFRLALPVLVAARHSVLAGELPLEAIAAAGNARIECEYARRALRAALWEGNLLSWQTSAALRQSDKTRALDRAIRLCRRVDAKRGGWKVSAIPLTREVFGRGEEGPDHPAGKDDAPEEANGVALPAEPARALPPPRSHVHRRSLEDDRAEVVS